MTMKEICFLGPAMMLATLVWGAGITRVPTTMSYPEEMMALHEQRYSHTVSWVELEDGSILMSGNDEFRISKDGGITWGEAFHGLDAQGGQVKATGLVRLSGRVIGLVFDKRLSKPILGSGFELQFRRSEDNGKTWSAPVRINSPGLKAQMWQDVMFRTSSGRIIIPAYMLIGRGGDMPWHEEGMPFVGGLVNGNFVSVDAEFFNPHLGASYVFYSDDEGKTWQTNRDGEIFILRPNEEIYGTAEPSVTEVSPGKLLMFMRTGLGRYFQAWSHDNGETWTRPQPTQLAGTRAPAQIRTLKGMGHLLCVFTQQSEEEVRKGFVRTRLSSAISRNGGGVWEHFQNVESLDEITRVEPGPIHIVRPAGGYPMGESGASENDPKYIVPLPVGYGRWSYPSVLVLKDRVLISYTYSWHDESGKARNRGGSRLKVLPLRWFYGGVVPFESDVLKKIGQQPHP